MLSGGQSEKSRICGLKSKKNKNHPLNGVQLNVNKKEQSLKPFDFLDIEDAAINQLKNWSDRGQYIESLLNGRQRKSEVRRVSIAE